MVWIIVLLLIGIIGIIGYRYYINPPLSSDAKQQRQSYIQRFKYGRTLVYHMPASQITKLESHLRKCFRFTRAGCYYGNGIMIQLQVNGSEVILDIFCPTEDHLRKYLWQLMQLKKQIETTGGLPHSTPNG